MPRKPRDYQLECENNLRAAVAEGCNKNLAVSPTGTGKGFLIARTPRALGMKRGEQAVVVVHRKDLVTQLAESLREENPDLNIDVERAQFRADPDADIVVASIQTIGKASKKDDPLGDAYNERLRQFNPDRVRHVIIDEAHMAPMAGGDHHRVQRYFGVSKRDLLEDDPTKTLTAFTATANRADNIGMESIVDRLAFARDIRTMMQTGLEVNGELRPWLSSVRSFRCETTVDIRDVSTRQGDFVVSELEDTINTPARNEMIVEKHLEIGEKMTFFAFTSGIQHTKDLVEKFQKAGLKAFAYDSTVKDRERTGLMAAIRAREIDGLVSCDALCLDEETEILTASGWTGINDMSLAHKVANWHRGRIYFREPSNVIRRQRGTDERMVSLGCQDFNIRVTEDHNMLYRTWRVPQAAYRKCRAADLVKRRFQIPCSGIMASPLLVTVPQERRTNRGRLIAALSYSLRVRHKLDGPTSKAEATKRVDRKLRLRYKQPHELTLAECGLIGFWIGDGTATKMRCGGFEWVLCQSTRYGPIIDWIRKTLSEVGVHFIERRHKAPSGKDHALPYLTWSLPRGTGGGDQARDGIYHLEPYLNKRGSPFWWGFNSAQFDAFIQGLWLADGSHGLTAVHTKKSFQIHGTSERKSLDLIQAIAVCHGYYANLTTHARKNPAHAPINTLTLKKCANLAVATKPLEFEQAWVPERVWCVTTDSGNIVTRRRGKVAITGNSVGVDVPSIGVLHFTRPTKSTLLFQQQFGRGARPYPAPEQYAGWKGFVKPYFITIDYVDVCAKHPAQSVPNIFGLRPDFNMKGKKALEVVEEAERLAAKTPGINLALFNDLDKLKGAVREINLFAKPTVPPEIQLNSQLAWTSGVSAGVYQISFDQVLLTIKENTLGQFEMYKHVNGIRSPLGSASDLARALALAEIEVPSEYYVTLQADAKWRFAPASDKQLGLLKRLYPEMRRVYASDEEYAAGIRSRYSKGDVSTLINARGERMQDWKGRAPAGGRI